MVDVFPTVVEALGLPQVPLCPEVGSDTVSLCREGNSLLPLMREPSRSQWKMAAFSQKYSGSDKVMGYSMRTVRYRYTEWTPFDPFGEDRPSWEEIVGAELYDYKLDPEETLNRVDDPKYQQLRQSLSEHLRAGWRPQEARTR